MLTKLRKVLIYGLGIFVLFAMGYDLGQRHAALPPDAVVLQPNEDAAWVSVWYEGKLQAEYRMTATITLQEEWAAWLDPTAYDKTRIVLPPLTSPPPSPSTL